MKRKTVQTFIKKGGYETVEAAKKKWRTWGLLPKLRKQTGLSKPILIEIKKNLPTEKDAENWLKGYTHEARRVEKFEESESWKIIRRDCEPKLRTYLRRIKRAMTYAFYLLGNAEPLDWTEEEMKRLRMGRFEDETKKNFWLAKIYNPKQKDVKYSFTTNLRRGLEILGLLKLREAFGTTGKPEAHRLDQWLQDEQIFTMFDLTQEVDTLLAEAIGILGGGRISSTLLIEAAHIQENHINMMEPKVKHRGGGQVQRIYDRKIIELLENYIKRFKIKGRIFKFSEKEFNERLIDISRKAKIFWMEDRVRKGKIVTVRKYVTSHILKHTFVSQASRHGVPSEAISDQTGTEWSTLKSYYRGTPSKLARKSFLGIEDEELEDWVTWVNTKIYPALKTRYDFLIAEGLQVKVNGIKSKPAKKPMKRKVSVAALEGLADKGASEGIRIWAKKELKKRK